MLKKLTPLLLAIFTAGLIASCSSTDPLLGEAESNIEDSNYEAAQTAANKYIQQNPDNPLGYYWKGVALGQEGEAAQAPEQATPLYKQMDEAFQTARQKASNMEESPGELERIDPFKLSLWRTEHNTAVQYASNDSMKQTVSDPLQRAVNHLQNATIIQPDSALSWGVMAQVEGMRENFEKAAEAQEKFIELKSNPEAQEYLLLAQYYRNGDQPEKAIATLEKARERYPDSTRVVEILADSYSQAGEAEKAIGIVEELVEKDPSNARYRLSLGTQIYQSALEIQNEYDQNVDKMFDLQQQIRNASGSEQQELQQQYNELESENAELMQEIDSLTERAIEQLNVAKNNESENPNIYNTLGVIYQNKAAVLFDQRNLTTDNEKAAQLDKEAKSYLRDAMTNYEQAAELDPDNPKYWRSLFQIYTALGMDEKAKEAEQKAGMQ